MTYYMAVAADKYELPLAVAETAQELAEMMNTGTNNVLSAISNCLSGKNSGIKYLAVRETPEFTGLVFVKV